MFILSVEGMTVPMEYMALFSDVHSNALALEAVLADIEKQGIARIVNLGDSLYGPMDMHGTCRLLRSRPILHLRGNCDRLLLSPPEGSFSTMDQNRRDLTPEEREWLQNMPDTLEEESFFFRHGTPESDEIYMLEKLDPTGCHPRPYEELVVMTERIVSPVIACGHSHKPAIVLLPNGKTIINPGSVGLPAYRDETPVPHSMVSHTPHAKYTIASREGGGQPWRFAQISVPYDWETAAALAEANGRPDWAAAIRSGNV